MDKKLVVYIKAYNNHLQIRITDADDMAILRSFFDNVLAKAEKSIAEEPTQLIDNHPPKELIQ